MALRNYSLRVLGAAEDVEQHRAALRGVAKKLGSRFVTVRPEADDVLMNVVFDVPGQRSSVDRLLEHARRSLPRALDARLVVDEAPDRAHEISARLLEERRHGTAVLAGAFQAAEDLEAWNEFLREAEPRGLLELGTATGAFSSWLNERVEWFRTTDVATPERAIPGFVRLDVWSQADEVRKLISKAPRPFVLYCDNGNKPLEVDTFAPALQVGDFLAVHDLGTEIFEQHIPASFTPRLAFGLTGFFEKVG